MKKNDDGKKKTASWAAVVEYLVSDNNSIMFCCQFPLCLHNRSECPRISNQRCHHARRRQPDTHKRIIASRRLSGVYTLKRESCLCGSWLTNSKSSDERSQMTGCHWNKLQGRITSLDCQGLKRRSERGWRVITLPFTRSCVSLCCDPCLRTAHEGMLEHLADISGGLLIWQTGREREGNMSQREMVWEAEYTYMDVWWGEELENQRKRELNQSWLKERTTALPSFRWIWSWLHIRGLKHLGVRCQAPCCQEPT